MKALYGVFLALFIALLACCNASDDGSEDFTLAELVTMAKEAMKDGDGYSAGLLYVQAVQREPRDVSLWLGMTEAFEKAGKYDVALSAVRSCVLTANPYAQPPSKPEGGEENQDHHDKKDTESDENVNIEEMSNEDKEKAFRKEAEKRQYMYVKPPINRDSVQQCYKAACRILLHVDNITLDDLDACYMSVLPEPPPDTTGEDYLRVGLVLQRAGMFKESVLFLRRSYTSDPTRFCLQSLCISLLASAAQEDANRCADLLEVADPDGTRSRAIISIIEQMDTIYQNILKEYSGDDEEEGIKKAKEFREQAVKILMESTVQSIEKEFPSDQKQQEAEPQPAGVHKEEL